MQQTVPICTKLHQSSPAWTKLLQSAPSFTKLHQCAPSCTKHAPIRNKLHQTAPICTNILQTAPIYTHSCTSLHHNFQVYCKVREVLLQSATSLLQNVIGITKYMFATYVSIFQPLKHYWYTKYGLKILKVGILCGLYTLVCLIWPCSIYVGILFGLCTLVRLVRPCSIYVGVLFGVSTLIRLVRPCSILSSFLWSYYISTLSTTMPQVVQGSWISMGGCG